MENLQTPIPDKRHCCTTSPVARSEYKTFLQHWSTKETCFFTTCASRQQQPRTVRIKKRKNWNYIFYIFLIIITSSLERTSLEKKIRREIMTKYIRIKTLQMNGSNFKMRVFKKKRFVINVKNNLWNNFKRPSYCNRKSLIFYTSVFIE